MPGVVSDTQVLTPTGWLDIGDYEGETVAMYDVATGKAFWDKAEALNRTESTSVALLHTRSGVHIAGSPDLEVLTINDNGHLAAVELDALLHTPLALRVLVSPKNGFMFNQHAPITLDDTVWRLWVMTMADGHEYCRERHRVKVVVARPRKVCRATKLLLASGLKFSQHPYFRIDSAKSGPYVQVNAIDQLDKYPVDKRALYCDFRFRLPVWGKHVTPETWLSLTDAAAKVIVDELPLWDGSVSVNGRVSWACTDLTQVDFFQYVMLTQGIKAQVNRMTPPVKPNWSQCYNITFTKSTQPVLLANRESLGKSALSGVYNVGPVPTYNLDTKGTPYLTRNQGKVAFVMGDGG